MSASSLGPARLAPANAAGPGRRLSSVPVIWLTTIAFIAFLVGGLVYSKQELEQRVREQIATVTQLAADRTSLTFDAGDQLLRSLVAELTPADLDPASNAVHRSALQTLLARKQSTVAGVVSLRLLNADGVVLAATGDVRSDLRPDWPPVIQALTGTSRNAPAIARAEPVAGIRGVNMARRIEDSGGRLLGFALARLELEQSLVRFCQSLAFDNNDLIALRDPDDGLLAGYPTDHDPLAGSGAATIGEAIAGGDLGGIDYRRSSVDGISRLIAYRKLPHYPLYITYGKDVEDLLANWRYEMAAVIVVGLLALVVSTVLTIGIRRRALLTRQLETVRGHLVDSNNALRAALAASEIVAARDQLTGLWNRRTFDQRLQQAVAHLGRHDGVFSLLLLDLDHFKDINDRFGHVVGDEVLKRFADVLHERLRQNDVDARWGGEEFVVLADGAHLEAAFALAEHVRQAVANTVFTGPGHVTVSIGVAEYLPGETGDDLLARTDDALYEAKRTGRNCVVAASGLVHGERFFTGSAAPAPLFAEDFA